MNKFVIKCLFYNERIYKYKLSWTAVLQSLRSKSKMINFKLIRLNGGLFSYPVKKKKHSLHLYLKDFNRTKFIAIPTATNFVAHWKAATGSNFLLPQASGLSSTFAELSVTPRCPEFVLAAQKARKYFFRI